MKERKVTTEFGDALVNAIESKKDDINELVWKNKDGESIRLMDMSKDELQRIYTHTTDMLYNKSKFTPGRIQVKKNIKILIEHCNAELFLRYLLYDCNIDILKTNIQIIDFIRQNKANNSNLTNSNSVSCLFTSLPVEFETVTIGQLIDACLDKLEIVNRKMLPDKFILSQGIWLTEDEKEDLLEFDENDKQRPWLDVVKDRLLLTNVKLRVDPRGFTYGEFRSIIHLEPLSKISKLPSDTLRLLRDKVFVLLDSDVDYYINKWMDIKTNIEKVAQYKGFQLTQRSVEDDN